MDRQAKRDENPATVPATGAASEEVAGVPGDESPPGSRQSGQAVCPDCGGTGVRDGEMCLACGGGGMITALVGDA